MTPQEELAALRRLVELEAKSRPTFEQRLAAQPAIDPTADMSFGERALAGAGKGFVDLGRGVQQLFDNSPELQAQIDEQAKLDKPLMATGAGLTGNIVGGSAVPMAAAYLAAPVAGALIGGGAATAAALNLPRAASLISRLPAIGQYIPAANTLAGSTAQGALFGALQPVTSDQNRFSNTATGAVFGGVGQALGNVAPRAMAALTAPFREGGRARIIAETLRQFANDPDAIARAATSRVPGVEFTLAESTRDPGLAILQRTTAAGNPQGFGAELAERELGNIAAARNAVAGIAGDQPARNAALAAREAAAAPFYDIARNTMAMADPELARLLQRPEIAAAFRQARENAANRGEQVAANFYTPAARVTNGLEGFRDVPEQFGDVSGDVLHQVKMALDASLASGPQRGIQGANANAIRSARDDFLGWLEDRIPAYQMGRTTFANESLPINQMDIGQALLNRMEPALQSMAGFGPTRLSAEQFARGLRNIDGVAQDVTGMGGITAAQVLTPAQQQTLGNVTDYLARRQFAAEAGRGPGSNTAQNLAGNNFLRSIAGPLGLPESWLESQLSRNAAALLSPRIVPYEANLQQQLAEALLNPQTASGVLQQGLPGQVSQQALDAYTRALGALSVGAGTASQ